MNLRYIDWIWHIRGSLELDPGQSGDEAFDRLDALFRETGTSHERASDTLTFRKRNPAAQDKMSIFDGGVLRIEQDAGGPVLRYDLTSRILLLCFLAPLLFLAFAGLNVAIGILDKPSAAELAAEKKKAEAEKQRYAEQPQHPIDKILGAPAPEMPEDEKDQKDEKDQREEEEEEEEDNGSSPTPGYVFAGIFAALYVGGRLLEQWLIKSLFRKRLSGVPPSSREAPLAKWWTVIEERMQRSLRPSRWTAFWRRTR